MDTDATGYDAPPPTRPVFVDASGRRRRWTRGAGWAVTSLLVGYLLLVIAALVGPSQLSGLTLPGLGPVLPGPAAAPLRDGGGTRDDPQAVLEATHPPTRSTPRATPPAARTTPAPIITPAPPTATSSPPGRSGTAPGRARPTATASATASASPSDDAPPRSTRAPSPRPRPSRSKG